MTTYIILLLGFFSAVLYAFTHYNTKQEKDDGDWWPYVDEIEFEEWSQR
tara:strand:+ start:417 stop:563 length:147 start_codon:yes stop_codon:yes gene_type:complete